MDEVAEKLLKLLVATRTFCKPNLLPPSASSSMTSILHLEMKGKMSREKMLARAKRKRESSSDTPPVSTFSIPSGKVVAKDGDKQILVQCPGGGIAARLRTRGSVISVNTHDVSLPPNFLANESLGNGIWPDAEKLLFPAAKERLDSIDIQSINAQSVQLGLQCVQNGLAIRLRLSQIDKEVATLNEKVVMLQEKFLKANQAKEQAEKALKDTEVKLKQKEAELTKTVDRLNSQVVGLQEELKDQEAEIIMRVQATMANQLLLGKADKKDLQSIIDDYLQIGCIKDLESEEAKKEETADALASTDNSGSTGLQGDAKKE